MEVNAEGPAFEAKPLLTLVKLDLRHQHKWPKLYRDKTTFLTWVSCGNAAQTRENAVVFPSIFSKLFHQRAAYIMKLESLQHPESRFLVFIPLQQTQTSPTLSFYVLAAPISSHHPLLRYLTRLTLKRKHRFSDTRSLLWLETRSLLLRYPGEPFSV